MARLGRAQPFPPILTSFILAPSAVLSGTVTTGFESQIVAGGLTVILTLSGTTWVASGATFDAQRQNIINGLTSAQSELLGWNNVVKALQGVAGVVRTSDTIVTITLDAQATYSITANETITATIPSTAVAAGLAIVAAPTFTITEGAPATIPDLISSVLPVPVRLRLTMPYQEKVEPFVSASIPFIAIVPEVPMRRASRAWPQDSSYPLVAASIPFPAGGVEMPMRRPPWRWSQDSANPLVAVILADWFPTVCMEEGLEVAMVSSGTTAYQEQIADILRIGGDPITIAGEPIRVVR